MESISIDLTFDAVWQSVAPTIQIVNDDKIVVPATLIENATTIKFDLELETDCSHTLELYRQGHDGINHQILRFESFAVDDLDISALIDHGRFYPVYPEPWFSEQQQQGVNWPEYHQRWREWGWNGVWKLDYRCPFYTWLLKTV